MAANIGDIHSIETLLVRQVCGHSFFLMKSGEKKLSPHKQFEDKYCLRFITPWPRGQRGIVISANVCLSVCPSVLFLLM